ncbi:hypothetical protein AB6A40_000997 [Gnathostoma spinigerum]|uniref:Sema domain-containing protein n=1 Tax=Gnathostoma spinigerum TaxID=75299 RepID=A0ABD6E370_9BILA
MLSSLIFAIAINIVSSFLLRQNYDSPTTIISLQNDPLVLRFGNTNTSDFFKLLDLSGDHLLIGARDVVYNISISSFTRAHSIKWPSKESVMNECQMKGKPNKMCHNFVRILTRDAGSNVLVCGTNSYQPLCRQYKNDKFGEYHQIMEYSGLGIAPYDPTYNSTFLRDGDLLYAGTVSDFSGVDPLIHRRNVSKSVDLGIRTQRNEITLLNDPQFVGSFKDDQYAYIWFREKAVEAELSNPTVYSRVARLCRSDVGGPRQYSNEWTSFLKARLNCSIPGDYPFYFDQIEAISAPVEGKYGGQNFSTQLVYGVFQSPLAGVVSSAICAFEMNHISNVFAHSTYHIQSNQRWSPPHDDDIPTHRPGSCAKDSRLLSEETVAFARSNPLLHDAVQNFFATPLNIHSGGDLFTQIVLDPQVQALDSRTYDVLFIGTNTGKVFKYVNTIGSGAQSVTPAHLVYAMEISKEPIRNMMLYDGQAVNKVNDIVRNKYLIVVTDRIVYRVPLTQCSRFSTCSECIALRDPQCAWDSVAKRCVALDRFKKGDTLQQQIIPSEDIHGVCMDSVGNANILNDAPLSDQPYSLHKAAAIGVFNSINDNCSCEVLREKGSYIRSDTPYMSRSSSDSNNTSGAFVVVSVGICVLSTLFGFCIGLLYSYCRSRSLEKSSFMDDGLFKGSLQPVCNGTIKKYPITLDVINAYESLPRCNGKPKSGESPLHIKVEGELEPEEKMVCAATTLPKNYRAKQRYL